MELKKCRNDHAFTERNADGRCPTCKSEKDKRYIAKEPERQEKRKERSKEWRRVNPERSKNLVRSATLSKKYGIDLKEYERLFNLQSGLCAICGLPERVKDMTGKIRDNLSVDHDHVTNKVRGLLCHHCNAALGHVNDDIRLLKSLINYLEVR